MQPLILKHWSTLMLNRYIWHGNESELWTQSSMLCKLIIDMLQPVKHKFQLEQLSNQNKALIEVVNDELYETQQDKTGIDIQLSRTHLQNDRSSLLANWSAKPDQCLCRTGIG